MSELIDQVDALVDEVSDAKDNDLPAVARDKMLEIARAYPELRAEIVRLEEERDRWHRDASEEYRRFVEENKRNVALVEALRQAESYIEVNVLGVIREALDTIEEAALPEASDVQAVGK